MQEPEGRPAGGGRLAPGASPTAPSLEGRRTADLASHDLQVTRIGTQHQAGSDSLLTAATFFKMRKVFFDDRIEDEFYRCGHAKPQNSFISDLCDC
jgi:hypothetical protein